MLKTFPRLRHLGSFGTWKMCFSEANNLISRTRLSNRNIVFDEDLHSRFDKSEFQYNHIEDRHRYVGN